MKHQTKEMAERIRRQLRLLTVILTLCSTTVLAACGSSDDQTGQDGKGKVAEIVSRGTLRRLHEKYGLVYAYRRISGGKSALFEGHIGV